MSAADGNSAERVSGETARFGKRRDEVIHAASTLINAVGVKGMTFAELAQAVGLNATSITYYFDRKDKLVCAVYEETLDWLEQAASTAAAEPNPAARVRSFIHAHFALRQRVREGEKGLVTALSEIRTLEEEAQAPLLAHYARIIEIVRGFFGKDRTGMRRSLDTARAHVLMEAMFWLPVWSEQYSTRDFDRVEARLSDIFAHGLSVRPGDWHPVPLDNRGWRTGDNADSDTLDAFMRAATEMINQRGYRGASVNRIAAELNVTKGSFYHHHEAKDDLVADCFTRSYDRLSAIQLAAARAPANGWGRIASALAEAIDLQFRDPMPLLRTAALQALPEDARDDVVLRANRLAMRFAGMLADGIADGSVRPVDQILASHVLMPALNAAYEARKWAGRQSDPAVAVKLYAWVLCAGFSCDPPEVG
ncbi:TetR/AcrR family transcriptional regulator [Tsuneonella flava]|uniref:TetR/AcrR family transcriptional regulator n=1 Tax=Tsuneonella flava TaxID=2055955 RepID=A0ABX7KDN9_9SPHN|nr:TetR/AcrR family transcriptional regulator [Tsuneonella flava]QSB45577.1 TetR/AcrR family transcriptional regulator [Tsuneonella flava]